MNSARHREKASPTLRPLAHSITSACAQLGIGRTKLYAMLSTGELESSKLGRRRVVIDRSIVALLDRTSVSPAATCLINPGKSGQPRRRKGRGERQKRRSDRGDAAAAAVPQVDEGPTT